MAGNASPNPSRVKFIGYDITKRRKITFAATFMGTMFRYMSFIDPQGSFRFSGLLFVRLLNMKIAGCVKTMIVINTTVEMTSTINVSIGEEGGGEATKRSLLLFPVIFLLRWRTRFLRFSIFFISLQINVKKIFKSNYRCVKNIRHYFDISK